MDKLTIARPYAKAVFATALADNTLADWANVLTVLSVMAKDHGVQSLMNNPKLGQAALVDFVISIKPEVFSDAAKRFVTMLIEHHRLGFAPEIETLFLDFKADHEKTAIVYVTAAKPLLESQQTSLKDKLSQTLQRDVKLHCDTDATLIGGMVIRCKDFVWDRSVKTQLAQLQQALCA